MCWLLLAAAASETGLAAEAVLSGHSVTNLTELPIEKLMNIQVTSVSKRPQKLSSAAAAITVITGEDIQRSGATTIPEALRLVPGLDVAQVDMHDWAISSRGFNDVFANKLLVLMDGRSIYTPLFSGVFWDVQDTLMEDIDRIEVIRGPGATLWGANAVDGVINITTKSAKETQGLLLTGGGGDQERGFSGLRYGGQVGDRFYWRVYGKYFDRAQAVMPDGVDAHDGWNMEQGGFRTDWDISDNNLLTVQGDLYDGRLGQIFGAYDPANPPGYVTSITEQFGVRGGNALSRWSHTFSEDADMKFQVYYDRTVRDTAIFNEDRGSYDLDFQHHFALGDRNEVTWGLGYRLTEDAVGNSPSVQLTPAKLDTQLGSAFAQDEITLVRDRLRLALGSKFEHNDFTGYEVEPGARISWTPHPRHTVWASVSRAVRTPSQAEEDVRLNQVTTFAPGSLGPGLPPVPVTGVVSLYGSRGFGDEDLVAYELGYRVQPHERVSVDLATFYNVYTHLRSLEPGPSPTQPLTPPPPPPFLFVPFHVGNLLKGNTYGFELTPTWNVCDAWRLQVSYSLLKMDLETEPGSGDTRSVADEGRSPQQQVSLRSSMDLPAHVQVDIEARYVDRLPTLGVADYATLDARVAWRPRKNLELAVVGQNLLQHEHLEFLPSFIATQPTAVVRGVYGKVTVQF